MMVKTINYKGTPLEDDQKKDKFSLFSKRMQELNDALGEMKKFGVGEEVLTAYLCHKLKLSEKKAKQIMNVYEEFFKSFIKKSILEAFK